MFFSLIYLVFISLLKLVVGRRLAPFQAPKANAYAERFVGTAGCALACVQQRDWGPS